MTPLPASEPPYSAAEVAALLGLSRRGINYAAARAKVGRILGNARVFSAADVETLRARPRRGRPRTGKPRRTWRYPPDDGQSAGHAAGALQGE